MTVSDSRSAAALAKDMSGLLDAGIMMEAGGHGLLTFRRQDLIVVSPGVPMDTPEVRQVAALGMPVIGELELASRFLLGRVVAITGSNGKTTTTTLVGEILKQGGVGGAGGGEYRAAGGGVDCGGYGGDVGCAGGFELSTGDGTDVSAEDCVCAEPDAGSSGSAWDVCGVCGGEEEDYGESDGGGFFGFERGG